jgi:hypothetical protein
MARLKPYWKTLFCAYGIIICLVALLSLSFKWLDIIEWVLLLLGFICLWLGI